MDQRRPLFLRRFRGRGGASGGGGGGGGVTFVTSNAHITAGANETITYDITGAQNGDLLVIYAMDPLASQGSITFSGSGAVVAATQVSVDGVQYQALYAHVLTTTELSAHTFATTWSANAANIAKIVRGPVAITTYSDWFQFSGPSGPLTYPAHTPQGGSLGLDTLTADYNATSPTITVSPGSFTLDVNGQTAGPNSTFYSSRAASFSNVSYTISGFNGTGGRSEGFAFEYT